jgi:hypothetical protein
MQSIFSRAKRADLVAVCHEAIKATGGSIRDSKIKVLKHLGGRLLNDKDGRAKVRNEWLELYTSLCRYEEIDHDKLPTVNQLGYGEWCRVRAFETVRPWD